MKNQNRKAVAPSLGTFGVENFPLEHTDNAFAEIDELSKRWNDRLTINNTRFAERYMKGGLWLCVEMSLTKASTEKFIACFQGLPKFRRGNWCGGASPRSNGHTFEGRNSWNNSPVFIEGVEFIQDPQSVPFPSFVGFYPADKFFDKATSEFEEAFCSIIRKSVLKGSYWEIGFFERTIGCVSSIDHKTGGEVIEGTPGIVDDVTNECAPVVGNGFQQFDAKNLDRWFRIFISNDAIRFALSKTGQFSVKISKVLIGPVDLLTAAV